jgi:hypothetical protein
MQVCGRNHRPLGTAVPGRFRLVNAAELATSLSLNGTNAVVTDAATTAVLANLTATVDWSVGKSVRLLFTAYDPRGKPGPVAAATAYGTARHRSAPSPGPPRRRRRRRAGNLVNPPAFFTSLIGSTNPCQRPDVHALARWRSGSTLAAILTVNGVQTHDLSSFFSTVDFVKWRLGLTTTAESSTKVLPTAFIHSYEVMQGLEIRQHRT